MNVDNSDSVDRRRSTDLVKSLILFISISRTRQYLYFVKKHFKQSFYFTLFTHLRPFQEVFFFN